jgi:glycyl-tRNA synthetase beta chain
MLKPLLIEIGLEELPAIPFLKELPNIEKKWVEILEKNNLLCEFSFFYTPRRLVFWHREFAVKQPDSEEEFFGAPLAIAYKDGEPTNAALGFARKCGVDISELSTSTKGGKEVLYYKKAVEGKESKELLNSMINELLTKLHFGKSMRWASNKESFIRPIRWIVAKLDEQDIDVEAYNVKSSNISYGHRQVSFEPFTIDRAGEYFCTIGKMGVILYPDERRQIILSQFKKIEEQNGIKIEIDEELLDEVVAITENPYSLLGSFEEEFLKLPDEAIITSMKEHQRYFAVYKDEKLTNKFIVVSNAICEDYTKIVVGNEKVLRARLKDGMFFYENDLRNKWQLAGLEKLVFVQGLGTVADKVDRESFIASFLAKEYLPAEQEGLIKKAVGLSKADLMSEMVYEFTELQGTMGYYYAKAFGEEEEVALALKEQYLPDGSDSDLPSTLFSAIVALSYKLDLILALFSIGKIPTGTKDPFALRRACIGIIKIVLDQNIAFDIKRVFEILSSNYKEIDYTKFEEFFLERIYQYFDTNPSIIKAVVDSGERDLVKISQKISALDSIASSDEFKTAMSTFKRVANITKDMDIDSDLSVDMSLFEKDEEKALYESFNTVVSKSYTNYEDELDALFGLKDVLDNFFDQVMVNAEDEKIKTNRKNLITSIYKEFLKIADIKEITL